jgi:hypothetical protein
VWCVNEDAEYHEAGAEGDQSALPATPAEDRRAPSADQAAALASVRDVPQRIVPEAQPRRDAA